MVFSKIRFWTFGSLVSQEKQIFQFSFIYKDQSKFSSLIPKNYEFINRSRVPPHPPSLDGQYPLFFF